MSKAADEIPTRTLDIRDDALYISVSCKTANCLGSSHARLSRALEAPLSLDQRAIHRTGTFQSETSPAQDQQILDRSRCALPTHTDTQIDNNPPSFAPLGPPSPTPKPIGCLAKVSLVDQLPIR